MKGLKSILNSNGEMNLKETRTSDQASKDSPQKYQIKSSRILILKQKYTLRSSKWSETFNFESSLHSNTLIAQFLTFSKQNGLPTPKKYFEKSNTNIYLIFISDKDRDQTYETFKKFPMKKNLTFKLKLAKKKLFVNTSHVIHKMENNSLLIKKQGLSTDTLKNNLIQDHSYDNELVKEYLQLEAEAKMWIERNLKYSLESEDLYQSLFSGITLCRLINLFYPKTIQISTLELKQRENIENFLKVCKQVIGLKEVQLFQIDDLWNAEEMIKVFICLFYISEKLKNSSNLLPTFKAWELLEPVQLTSDKTNRARKYLNFPLDSEQPLDPKYARVIPILKKWIHRRYPRGFEKVIYLYLNFTTLRKNLLKRSKVWKEILSTELVYLTDLKSLITKFKVPLENLKKISSDESKEFFGPIEGIIVISETLINRMNNELGEAGENIGKIFLEFSQFLKIYVPYVSNYENLFHIYSKLQKKKVLNGLEENSEFIRDKIITPIQRIPRYSMLFNELLKYTPQGHKEYPVISQACKALEQTCIIINEKKKAAENVMEMLRIQERLTNFDKLIRPSRKFLFDAMLPTENLLSKKFDYVPHVFLFSDVLLITKEKPNGKLQLKHSMLLSNSSVLTEDSKMRIIVYDNSREGYRFSFHKESEFIKWKTELITLKEMNEKTFSSSLADSYVYSLYKEKEENKEEKVPIHKIMVSEAPDDRSSKMSNVKKKWKPRTAHNSLNRELEPFNNNLNYQESRSHSFSSWDSNKFEKIMK